MDGFGFDTSSFDVGDCAATDLVSDIPPLEDLGDPVELAPGLDMSELQNEADMLDIEPLTEDFAEDVNDPEVVDLLGQYGNAGDADFSPFPDNVAGEEAYEPSALSNIIGAAAEGAASPSDWAQFGAGIVGRPGTEDVLAQGFQSLYNGGKVFGEQIAGPAMHLNDLGPSLQDLQTRINIGEASEGYESPPLQEQDYFDEDGVMITDESLRE
jgi:hypothetical protein